MDERREGGGPPIDYSVFVGDLAPEIDDASLASEFAKVYSSVLHAKIIRDPITNWSKGFGFVRFSNQHERDRALNEMNGVVLHGRAIRVSMATRRNPGSEREGGREREGGYARGGPPSSAGPTPGELDPNNCTLFIGGLSASVTEHLLLDAFHRYGTIVYVKVPEGKGVGFVQYQERHMAEAALAAMHGVLLGGTNIRVSWGRKAGGGPSGAGGDDRHRHAMASYYGASYGGYDHYSAAAAQYSTAAYGAAAGYAGYQQYPGYPAAGAYHPYGYAAAYGHGADAAYAYGQQAGDQRAAGAPAGTKPSAGDAGPGAVQAERNAPPDINKLNEEFMQRQVPWLTGGLMRAPTTV